MVEDIDKLTKEDYIHLLINENTKEEIKSYLRADSMYFIRKFQTEQLYEILSYVNEDVIIKNFIEIILQNKKDYYLFLTKNKKEKRFNKYINEHILDILYKNNMLIKTGKGSRIQNTILYGLEEEQILKNIKNILEITLEDVWNTFLQEIPFYPNIFSYFQHHSFYIIETALPKERVFPYIRKMKEADYKNIVEENEEAIIARLTNVSADILKIEKLMLPIKVLIKELLLKTNTKIEDIEYKGSGSYKDFYKIGNLGIKSGKEFISKKIPSHPRFLKPFMRKEIIEDNFLEVYKYVDTNVQITEEDVYTVYKELREDGIIWLDPRIANIGVLKEDNTTNINAEEIKVKEESIHFTLKNENKKTYKKGDLIILDVSAAVYEEDFILDDYEKLDINLRPYKRAEERYRCEKWEYTIKHK